MKIERTLRIKVITKFARSTLLRVSSARPVSRALLITKRPNKNTSMISRTISMANERTSRIVLPMYTKYSTSCDFWLFLNLAISFNNKKNTKRIKSVSVHICSFEMNTICV